MSDPLSGIVYGLGAAACWGAGDFSGGVASKKNNAFSVVIVSQATGGITPGALALLFSEPIAPLGDLLWAGLAGICGGIGLVAFYYALARGRMGVIAPVAALVTLTLPVIAGTLIEGSAEAAQLVGFGCALVAVWLVTKTGDGLPTRLRDLGWPVFAGTGFGLFMIFMDHASQEAVFWPLIAERIIAISVLSVIARLLRQIETPARDQLPMIALVGFLDAIGTVLFTLAAQSGRLDAAAVLSSLYPAGTVLLAWMLLKERLGKQQWAGVVVALIAILLIAA